MRRPRGCPAGPRPRARRRTGRPVPGGTAAADGADGAPETAGAADADETAAPAAAQPDGTPAAQEQAGPAVGVAAVLLWAKRASARLMELEGDDDRIAGLAEEEAALAADVAELSGQLTAARTETAERFAADVTAELTALAMPHARVTVAVTPLREPGPYGADDIEVRLAAHPGAPALPLHKGASGGELSRVMLAIEVVFAGADPVPTFVFDEVDAGVGGKAAVEVGRRLARLARPRAGHRRDAPAAGSGLRGHPPDGRAGRRRLGDQERGRPAGHRRAGQGAVADAGRPGGLRVRPGARRGTARGRRGRAGGQASCPPPTRASPDGTNGQQEQAKITERG